MQPTKEIDVLKKLIEDPTKRITLDEVAGERVRRFLADLQGASLLMDEAPIDGTTIANRLQRYDELGGQLLEMATVLGRWGNAEQAILLRNILSQVAEANTIASGMTFWLKLRWYPLCAVIYCAGISALSTDNYTSLAALFSAKMTPTDGDSARLVFAKANSALAETSDAFKLLPGHENKKVPFSEVMFERLRPRVEGTIFLGARFEELFDRFEVFNALMHAEQRLRAGHPWGPVGRFAWKSEIHGGGPFAEVRAEADEAGPTWKPLQAGLFRGSLERFKEVAEAYAPLISRFGW